MKTKDIFQGKGAHPKDSWKQVLVVENLQCSMMPRRGKVKTVSMDDINVDYSSILDQAGLLASQQLHLICVFCMLTPVNPFRKTGSGGGARTWWTTGFAIMCDSTSFTGKD